MNMPLAGKVALVTGASSGIGAATAAALLNAGARVAVTARRVERLRELGQQLGAGADRWLAIEADVRREADAGQLLSSAVAWGGGLNILVNNAGLSRGNLVEGASTEDLRLMMETNLFALSNLSRLALPALKKSRGDLVSVSSTAATSFTPGSAFYAATKSAVATFSEILRKEVCNDGVRVMTVFPGLVRTEFFDYFEGEKQQRLKKMMDTVDGLTSEDLAEAILFLVTRPPSVTINELMIRPTKQP